MQRVPYLSAEIGNVKYKGGTCLITVLYRIMELFLTYFTFCTLQMLVCQVGQLIRGHLLHVNSDGQGHMDIKL